MPAAFIHERPRNAISRKSLSNILHSPGPIEPEDGLFIGPWLIASYKILER
jgi:hypothetical protein